MWLGQSVLRGGGFFSLKENEPIRTIKGSLKGKIRKDELYHIFIFLGYHLLTIINYRLFLQQ